MGYQLGPNKPLKHDVHFWLGESTTQDEAGTAAYKTVELDDRLGRAAVQHREVQNHESDLFLQYFPEYTIEILEGGIESGFNHVKPTEYQPRLLQIKGTNNNLRVTQVPKTCDSLNSGDCFILDLGMTVIQWNGSSCSLFEKVRAGQVVRAIRDERGGKPEALIFDENDNDPSMNQFWDGLGGKGRIKTAAEGGSDKDAAAQLQDLVKLFRLSDKSGSMKFTLEKSGDLSKRDLDTNDTFILDNGAEIFVWIGKKASANEKKLGMQYAQRYLSDYGRPAYLPISRVLEGSENELFNLNFGGGMLTRDIDFNAPESGGRAPCCPHHPTGSHSAAPASSGGSSLPAYAAGGAATGAVAGGAAAGASSGLPAYAAGGSRVSAVSSLTQRFGGKNAVKGQSHEARELEDAAKQVFSVFKNKFKF